MPIAYRNVPGRKPTGPGAAAQARAAALLLIALLTPAFGASAAAADSPAAPAGGASPAANSAPASKRPPADSGSGNALAARGKYIALAADCMSCHTAPGGKPYAGGEPLKSQFGTLYGPNITPDVQTGIGSWTQADFDKALRLGVGKGDKYLYPAMPYDAYTKMTPADVAALWAYMRAVPAVSNTTPKNTLPFPLDIRSGMALWQSLYFKPGQFQRNSAKGSDWNRGAYLVEALAHCSDCHTPRNLAQGLESQHLLSGAQIEGWYAPDISSDAHSKLHDWNTVQLAKFLKTGTLPDNTKAFGPMQEAVHDSLRFLKDADLTAMAVYLKDQPREVSAETPSRVQYAADRLTVGKQVYEDSCSSCHQGNGKGMSGSVPALAGNDSVTASEPYNVIMAILEGFPPQGTWGAMGSFAQSLNDDQIADVANYVRTAWGNKALPNATPWAVTTWRKNADSPNNESHALLCPSLSPDIVQPALSAGTDALKQAASSPASMSKLVGNYRTARPKTSSAEVVEALSTAYCRAVSADPISKARMSAEVADFAQRVAVALGSGKATT